MRTFPKSPLPLELDGVSSAAPGTKPRKSLLLPRMRIIALSAFAVAVTIDQDEA
jgi:hypothetical protein